jgi:hypothetical protein
VRKTIVPNPDGKTYIEKVYGSKDAFDRVVDRLVLQALDIVRTSAEGQSRRVIDKIEDLDDSGLDLQTLKDKVSDFMDERSSWRDALAKSLTTQAVEGIKYEAYSNGTFNKKWHTQRDERVRHSHYAVDGDVKALGEPFLVGDSLLQFPGDPSGSLEQIIGCRCWLVYEKV